MTHIHLALTTCLAVLVLVGCSSSNSNDAFAVMPVQSATERVEATSNDAELSGTPQRTRELQVEPWSNYSPLPSTSRDAATEILELYDTEQLVNVTIPQQELGTFIDTVFGDILSAPYALDETVLNRDDLVSLRSVQDLSKSVFFELVTELLSEYGVAVENRGEFYYIQSVDSLRAQAPEFISARSRPDTPNALRPIVQFVQLEAMDAAEMQTIIQLALGNSQDLSIQARRDISALTLTGLSDDVDAALEIIDRLDVPRFARSNSVIISPRNWSARDLASTLRDVLTIEGYQVALGLGAPKPITFLPILFTEQILIFADDRDALEYITSIAQRLEDAAARSEAIGSHIYQVRSRNAASLLEIITGVSAATDAEPGAQQRSNTPDLTLDEVGNRLIFTGTRAEFDLLRRTLEQLDTPAPEVLIEVTIAEITLADDMRFGVEFLLNTLGGDLELRTQGGLGLEAGGLSGVLRSGQVDLTAASRSTRSQINVLSTPRIVTRSGSEASVQVGTDVPIVTSQRAANTQQTGSTDILQTIQFRSTGVLLTVSPQVYSDDRIDIAINQEVSSALPNPNQAIASPIISNRSLTSELTLQDGQTAVLGGLIEQRINQGETAVPLLSDIPALGRLFSTSSESTDRTVLLVLVTPYVLRSRDDRQRLVSSLSEQTSAAFVTELGQQFDRITQ